MASISIDISLNWANSDEFQRLLQRVDETQKAYAEALTELSEFVPDIKAVTKGGNHE